MRQFEDWPLWLILNPGVIRSSSLASQCNRSLPQRNHADRQRLRRRDGSAPPAEPPEGRRSDRKALWRPYIRQSTFRPSGRHWCQQFQSIFAGRRSIFQNLPSPKYARRPARFPAQNSATVSLPTTQRFRLKELCPQIPVVDRPLRPRKKPRARPGASIFATGRVRSVPCDGRAAELVVQTGGDEIDVLTDAVGAEGEAARCGEVVGTVLHEQVIVLDAN